MTDLRGELNPDDREFGMQKLISGRMVEDSQNEVISYVANELRHAWEKAKVDYDFPDNAVPEWRISWYYIKRGESE